MEGTAQLGLDRFAEAARHWLVARLPVRGHHAVEWGVGSDDVSVFHRMSFQEEEGLLHRLMAWQQEKCDHGFGAISWPAEYGGAGLTEDHERLFAAMEADFDIPPAHETFSVTTELIAPTIRIHGTEEQKARFVKRFVRAEALCCQLFSEPGSGSDLAGLSTRAWPDGDEWIIDGQKVWSSGAQFSGWGELIARTDPEAPKHGGLTAFLMPMDHPGVEVRPIRQISGGTSFNEVFLTGVRLPDALRLGAVGDGWKVALTTLGFERGGTGSREVGGSWERLLGLARHLGRNRDPVIRQKLARIYTHQRLLGLNRSRAEAALEGGGAPGPEGSIGKLFWAEGLVEIGNLAAELLGPRITADSGDWGTYAWIDHLLGSLGYRIAGGSDQIQRNIIGERVLGLPGEPRSDRGPWNAIPR